jgi:CRP-like cAMP-binding protein
MVTKDDLKKIVMLSYFTDAMLDKLLPITDLLLFQDKDVVFNQGQKAERFYMVIEGKVLLEQRISDSITVYLSAVKPGFSFGWSSMLDDEVYTSDAVCAEQCQLLSIRAQKIKMLVNDDPALGNILHQRLLRIIKKRYDIRTEQFIKAIKNHPDISRLL